MNYINNLNQILLVNIKSNLITFHYKGINQKEFEKEIDKFILYLNKIKINFPLIKKNVNNLISLYIFNYNHI